MNPIRQIGLVWFGLGGNCREQAVYYVGNVALIAGEIENEDELYYLSQNKGEGGTRPIPAFVKSAMKNANTVIDAALAELHAQYEAEAAEIDAPAEV